MSQTIERFDYASLDPSTRADIQLRTTCIREIGRTTAAGIVLIGQHLTDVKGMLGHGQFLDWLAKEFGWSERSARKFMQVHRFVQEKSAQCADLEIDASALFLISRPSTPEAVQTELMERAAA